MTLMSDEAITMKTMGRLAREGWVLVEAVGEATLRSRVLTEIAHPVKVAVWHDAGAAGPTHGWAYGFDFGPDRHGADRWHLEGATGGFAPGVAEAEARRRAAEILAGGWGPSGGNVYAGYYIDPRTR
jgi:hypothetical protein